jgi:hypothetical protein
MRLARRFAGRATATIDVADDTLTVRAVMDRDQRKAMREQRRARLGRTGSSPALPPVEFLGRQACRAPSPIASARRNRSGRDSHRLNRMPSSSDLACRMSSDRL